MVKVNDMEFATSIGVLFALKESYGYRTLQETYKVLETESMDTMFDILRISYNKQNKTNYSLDQFLEEMSARGVGFMVLTDIFQKVVEGVMFDGLTPEQVIEKKKFLEQAAKR